MGPDGVAASAPLRERRLPHRVAASRSRRGRSSQADQRGEGVLGRSAGGSPATDDLLQLAVGGHPVEGGLVDDLVDPALDEREDRLEPDQRRLLRWRLLGSNSPPSSASWSAAGFVGSMPDSFDSMLADVDGGAAAVVLHGREEVGAEPRHVREQPLVGGLAEGEIEPDVVLGHVEALGEGGDVGRQQRGPAGGREREPDVGGAEHLGGETAERLADLAAEHRAAGLADETRNGPAIALASSGSAWPIAADHVLGHRLDELLPDRAWSARSTRRGSSRRSR